MNLHIVNIVNIVDCIGWGILTVKTYYLLKSTSFFSYIMLSHSITFITFKFIFIF